jgi:tetratricopeptide (TPR) repeat protein
VKLDRTSRNYLSKLTPETSRELEQFVLLLAGLAKEKGNQSFYLVQQFMDRRVNLPAAAALYVYYLDSGKDLNAYLKRLDEMAGHFPSDAGIQLSVATAVGYKAIGTLRKDMIKRLQTLVKENPNDSTVIANLAELLNDDGRYLEAIALCEEAVKRWPDRYRVWWAAAYILDSYASDVRGIKFWSEVPPKGKRMWRPLRDLAYRAVNRAIELHPYVSNLWVEKINAIAAYSEEMMTCFYKAIEYGPNNKRAYRAGLNYTLPQWGGSVKAQQEVWNLAVKNNPNAPWLEELRREYMKKPTEGF